MAKKSAKKKTKKSVPKGTKVVVVGAGAAGVFTAYRLREMYGDLYDITLVEANDRVGGNTYSRSLRYGDERYSIDCGAQFFYRYPQPSYVSLLAELGLFDKPSKIEAKATGITLWDVQKDKHLLWLPSHVGGFLRYKKRDWDKLTNFGAFLAYSFLLDRDDPNNWTMSVDDWLAKLHLIDERFKERVLKPFMYQFVTLPKSRIGDASALYAITYFARNVFGEEDVVEPDPKVKDPRGVETFEVYQSLIGLDGVLERALDEAGVSACLNEPVEAVGKTRSGKFQVVTSRRKLKADRVVLACDPQVSARVLANGGWTDASLIKSLMSLEYDDLEIAMQKDQTCWMPGNKKYWEAVNTMVDGDDLTFTAWFGPLRDTYRVGKKIPVFKSWASPDLDPVKCKGTFLAHKHRIVMPTTNFMKHRKAVMKCQGKEQLWFVGGWTNWFDSQEAALDSATSVADAFDGVPDEMTGKATMVKQDRDRQRRRIDNWLKRIARRAPRDRREALKNLMDEVESKG